MVRSAAKNFQDVLVVVDPADYPRVLAELERRGRRVERVPLRSRPEGLRAHRGLRRRDCRNARGVRGRRGKRHAHRPDTVTPPQLWLTLRKIKELRYGENPHQPAAWYAMDSSFALGVGAGAAGQGTVVHQSDRPRFGRAHRPRVHRAGGGRHQAHESMRRGNRPLDRGGVRSRARGRSACGLRRHHRAQPSDRRSGGAGARVDLHRSGNRPGRRGRGAADSRGQSEHARRRGRSDHR